MKRLRGEENIYVDDLPQRPVPDPWLIRCWRETLDLTQAELTAWLGWSAVSKDITRIESYSLPIAERRAKSVADAMGVTLDEILSMPDVAAANARKYAAWVQAGRPNIRKWIADQEV